MFKQRLLFKKLIIVVSSISAVFVFLIYIKKFIELFKKIILLVWISPLEKVLRYTSLDYASPRLQFNRYLTWFKDLGWLALTTGRVNIKRFEGSEWSITFIDEDFDHSEHELSNILFDSPPEIKKLKRVFLWQIPKLLPEFLSETDLVIANVNRHIQWHPKQVNYFFRTPPWIRMALRVDRPMDEILADMGRGRRSSLAKMQQEGFTYEFSRNLADLELFYHKMYVPYISSRHEDRAIIEPFETKQAMFQRGGLLLTLYQAQPVAGLLGETIGRTYIAGSLGIHEDYFELFEKGVVLAAYWSCIEWAQRNHLQYVDYGLTRAQLFDNVFWGKLLWGMKVQPNLLDDHTHWLFAARKIPVTLGHYLNKIGFIAECDEKYRCIFLAGEEFQPSQKKISQVSKLSPRLGLSEPLILGE